MGSGGRRVRAGARDSQHAPSETLRACVRMPGISGLGIQQEFKSLGSTTDISLDYGHF